MTDCGLCAFDHGDTCDMQDGISISMSWSIKKVYINIKCHISYISNFWLQLFYFIFFNFFKIFFVEAITAVIETRQAHFCG